MSTKPNIDDEAAHYQVVPLIEELGIEGAIVPNRRGELYRLAAAEIDRLSRELAEQKGALSDDMEMKRDAERYRWLRAFSGHRLQVMDRGQEMAYYDTALDAAIDREREGDCDEPIRTAADYDREIDATFASVKPLPGNRESEIVHPQPGPIVDAAGLVGANTFTFSEPVDSSGGPIGADVAARQWRENAVGNPQRPSEEWYRRKIEGGEAPAVIGAAHLRGRDAIDEMVDRFLAWPLPATVCSDLCVTDPTYPHRIGTNLLTAPEARAMLEHVLQGCHSQGIRQPKHPLAAQGEPWDCLNCTEHGCPTPSKWPACYCSAKSESAQDSGK